MHPLNHHPEKLKVGDKVVTDYLWEEENVVRTLTSISRDFRYGSGYRASADAGKSCRTCHRPFGRSVPDIDASWFIKYEDA